MPSRKPDMQPRARLILVNRFLQNTVNNADNSSNHILGKSHENPYPGASPFDPR